MITRAPKKSTSMGEADTRTIFVYLCGTDLESEEGCGAATSDVYGDYYISDFVVFGIDDDGNVTFEE